MSPVGCFSKLGGVLFVVVILRGRSTWGLYSGPLTVGNSYDSCGPRPKAEVQFSPGLVSSIWDMVVFLLKAIWEIPKIMGPKKDPKIVGLLL